MDTRAGPTHIVGDLVRHRRGHRDERADAVALLDVGIVPAEVVAQVEEERAAAVEGHRGALDVAEHGQRVRVDAEDVDRHGAQHKLDEAQQCRAVALERFIRRQRRREVDLCRER